MNTIASLFPVIESVIEQLDPNLYRDRATLIACNATSRQFSCSARKQLFSTVKAIMEYGWEKKLERLYSILMERPWLLTHIRHLEVGFPPSNSIPPESILLPSILAMMESREVHLESLCVRGIIGGRAVWDEWISEYPCWTGLPENIRLPILHILASPTVQSVDLGNIHGFPVGVLNICHGKRNLRVHLPNCFLGEIPQTAEILTASSPEAKKIDLLETVTIREGRGKKTNFILQCLFPASFMALRLKELLLIDVRRPRELDLGIVNQILERTSHTLEALHLTLGKNSGECHRFY
jgi:hypothetical protein